MRMPDEIKTVIAELRTEAQQRAELAALLEARFAGPARSGPGAKLLPAPQGHGAPNAVHTPKPRKKPARETAAAQTGDAGETFEVEVEGITIACTEQQQALLMLLTEREEPVPAKDMLGIFDNSKRRFLKAVAAVNARLAKAGITAEIRGLHRLGYMLVKTV